MSSIRELHTQAMDAAEAAAGARRMGEGGVVGLLQRAFELEQQAAELAVQADAPEPTRSILLRSAASLAQQLGRWQDAERLAAKALAGHPPPEIADELRNLLEQAYLDRHLSTKGMTLGEDQLQLTVSGEAIGYGWAPVDEVARRVEIVQSLVHRTAERQAHQPYRIRGRPKTDIGADFQVYMGVQRAASYAVVIRVARSMDQTEMFTTPAARVVDEIVDLLDAYSKQDDKAIKDRLRSPVYRNNFVGLAHQLGPNDVVRQVGLTIQRGTQERSVALRRDTWRTDTDAARKKPSKKRVELIGSLKLADARHAKSNTIAIVTDKAKEYKIVVPEGMMQDVVGPYWQQRVRVRGVRQRDGRVLLQTIDRA